MYTSSPAAPTGGPLQALKYTEGGLLGGRHGGGGDANSFGGLIFWQQGLLPLLLLGHTDSASTTTSCLGVLATNAETKNHEQFQIGLTPRSGGYHGGHESSSMPQDPL